MEVHLLVPIPAYSLPPPLLHPTPHSIHHPQLIPYPLFSLTTPFNPLFSLKQPFAPLFQASNTLLRCQTPYFRNARFLVPFPLGILCDRVMLPHKAIGLSDIPSSIPVLLRFQGMSFHWGVGFVTSVCDVLKFFPFWIFLKLNSLIHYLCSLKSRTFKLSYVVDGSI